MNYCGVFFISSEGSESKRCRYAHRYLEFIAYPAATIKEYGIHDEFAERSGGIYAEMFKAQAQYYVYCRIW